MRRTLVVPAILALTLSAVVRGQACLPGEVPAEDILNGKYPWPPSPAVLEARNESGLDKSRLSSPPPPGVHPRILLSPSDLPGLRARLRETASGKAMMATLRERTGGSILKPGTWENSAYGLLAAGDAEGALKLLGEKRKPSFPEGHYQPNIPYALTMEAFDAMVSEDAIRGKKVAAAIAGWAKAVEPAFDAIEKMPMSDDVWRAKLAGPTTGNWSDNQGLRDLMGNHLMGYAYDFAFNYMDDAQRAQVRRVISKATKGKVWLGARVPHHFRNWNWVNVGLGQPLLALAIEGEEGYDERVYKLGVEIAKDYLNYGISAAGCSTEAVGYTQFGFVWGAPFMVAAQRRGEAMLTNSRHRAMIDWYLHSMEPYGASWQSHGDGGDGGPGIHVMTMWKYFFPGDAKIGVLWDNFVAGSGGKPFEGRYHIIEPLIYASDPAPQATTVNVASLGLPNGWFDPERGSLSVRSGWTPDAASMQFECRTDSVGSSHEHADRGNFTFSALGRQWAKESFRSIETRHHNSILIDGKGQGFWPGPGRWLGTTDAGWAVVAVSDNKPAYDWWWPKQIVAEDPETFEQFKFPRWASYKAEAVKFHKDYAGVPFERDTRPSVVAHWQGFEATGPRMWDEDGWPVRLPHNPVSKAFRTVVFVREPQPYMVVIDDIRKDDAERLYEWIMMTGPNTDISAIKNNEVVLCDATVARDAEGKPKVAKGDRQLLVRALELRDPELARDYNTKPSIRLDTFEKKDTTGPDGRSFGMDKRLILPSRSREPGFKVILFPFRQGEALPETTWDASRKVATIKGRGFADRLTFEMGSDGRTRVRLERSGSQTVEAIEEAK